MVKIKGNKKLSGTGHKFSQRKLKKTKLFNVPTKKRESLAVKKVSTGGIVIKRPTKRFKQAITINQVGAEPVRTTKGTVWKLGGGMFTKKQILASRQRYGRVRFGVKSTKADFGM